MKLPGLSRIRDQQREQAAQCEFCGAESSLISQFLGVCLNCIRQNFEAVKPRLERAHRKARESFGLPPTPPHGPGFTCRICVNECQIAEGERSFCGARRVENGKLLGPTATKGNLSWYYDPLPTNCVADWVCPGGTGAGYPTFAHRRGPEYGYKNLAVFYQACSFDCLFCQNWHFRRVATDEPQVTASELAARADETTSCICFFGGDPTPQLPHAILVSRLARERRRDHILRICWETNGSMHPALLKQMLRLSLESGGCLKFDLKAWDERVHFALCGVSNRRTLENFKLAASYIAQRPSPPLLVASTLLVPGYVDGEEVFHIARFISSLNPEIPYALLAFYPSFCLNLPTTSKRHAEEALAAARQAGLKNVRIGNQHLLRYEDY